MKMETMNNMMNAADDNNSISKELFISAMKGEWNDVIKIYQRNPTAHKAKISRSGETALHVTVSDIQEDITEELVTLISQQSNPKEALEIRNELGNTALHIAASLGSVRICSCIAEVDHSLIGARNNDNETPLFVAALNGKKDAFLCLNSYVDTQEHGYSYSRRNDGQTILHCAISGDYFDLAFQIIHLYEGLANYVDVHGDSPLHILANKPTAFRSGSHLARLNKIIYHCIFVDDLKVDPCFHKPANANKEMQNMKFPDNYGTCIHFIMLWKKLSQTVSGFFTKKKDTSKSEAPNYKAQQKDAENPEAPNYRAQQKDTKNAQAPKYRAQGYQLFPPNYHTSFDFVKLVSKAVLIVLGAGSRHIKKLEEKKKKHTWSVQVMDELLQHEYHGSSPQRPSDVHEQPSDDMETKPYAVVSGDKVTYETESFRDDNPLMLRGITDDQKQAENGEKGLKSKLEGEKEKKDDTKSVMKREMPILIAASCGITEMVEKILELYPVAIQDLNSEKKNIVLLAVECRQPHVYQLLLKRQTMKDSMFRAVDVNGNSALHLAAMLGDHKPWLIPGAALQMQWEIKWYEFVKHSVPPHFFVHHNKAGKTPRDIFSDTHKELVEKGGEWLINTSQSCSVVAALIATVAFATSTTFPGGIKEESGKPTLEFHPAFDVFAISSLVALCFSVTAVVMFLAILTSRYQENDFGKDLPRKLLLGLTSLFVSIASMLVSFCAGHFFVLKDKLKYAAYPVYAVTCVPVTLFAVAQFPLYFDLAWATFKKVPQRSYRALPL